MLSVGEVASRAGIAVSAVHFYEKKGLISSTEIREISDVLLATY